MSLADLPAELIAHVTSYLNYDEIRNLMETSKKNYNAIKYYGKDRLTIETLNIDRGTATGAGFYDGHRFIFNGDDQGETKVNNIPHMVDTCWSIDRVFCNKIDDDFCKAMIRTKTKIGEVSSYGGYVTANPSNLIALCEMKDVVLEELFMSEALFCDEVFIKCMDSMYSEYETFENHVSLGLTDRTLEAYAENNRPTIYLSGITTSFTMEGIVKAVQAVTDRGNEVRWFLGILLEGQRDAAAFYFNKETGKLRNKFRIEIEYDNYFHRTRYILTTLEIDGQWVPNSIVFDVSEC